MQYTDVNRGKIQNRDRARQIIDFSGLRYNNITPTDMDGAIEYHDKCFVFYEFKLREAEMPKGQKLAFERLADACQFAGKQSVVFLCKHNVDNPDADIDAASAKVAETYYCHQWHKEDGTKTVKERSDDFLRMVDMLPFYGE